MRGKIYFILIFGISLLRSDDYALVIGINNGYLVGAKRDAIAMSSLLKQRGVEQVTTLYNEAATKENILGHLKDMVRKAGSGDRVYLFFSGHGTSAFDPSIQNNHALKVLLRDTGGLIPWGASTSDSAEDLIIAKRDLSPLFKILENKKVKSVIMFDACFSGSAYKDITANRLSNHSLFYSSISREADYPYKHIVYFSASTRSDYAAESRDKKRGYFSIDISRCLKQYNTLNDARECMKRSTLPSVILPRNGDSELFAPFREETKVKIIYPDQNYRGKGAGVVAIMVGNFVFNVLGNVIADLPSVQKLARDIETYIKEHGLDPEELVQRFEGKLRASIIEHLEPQKKSYRVSEKIYFDIGLKQRSYIYLMSVSSDNICLIFPNRTDQNNLYGLQQRHIPATDKYAIESDREGTEKFYLVASLETVSFDEFSPNGIYSCIDKKSGLRKLGRLKEDNAKDIRQMNIKINQAKAK